MFLLLTASEPSGYGGKGGLNTHNECNQKLVSISPDFEFLEQHSTSRVTLMGKQCERPGLESAPMISPTSTERDATRAVSCGRALGQGGHGAVQTGGGWEEEKIEF